ncbi:MAG TPA: peptidoglycan-binding protein [Oscillatoriaceae cyanobacterium]
MQTEITQLQQQLASIQAQCQALIAQFSNKSRPANPAPAKPQPAKPAPSKPQPAKPAPKSPQGSGPTLRNGDSGAPVKAMQQRLQQLGFNPQGVDGAFGPHTQAAVKAFQKAHHLTADGIVGPQTWKALGITVKGSVQHGATGNPSGPSPSGPGNSNATVQTSAGPMVTRQGKLMSPQIASRFDKMYAAAKAAGINLQINMCYRSYAEQVKLYQLYLSGKGAIAAKPGTSNHEKGLAIDFLNTPGAYAWLKANAAKFGLYNYPPEAWHYSINGSGGPPGSPGTPVTPAAPPAPSVITVGLA